MAEPSPRISFAASPGKRRHGLIVAGLFALIGVIALLSAGPGLPDGGMIGGLALALAAGFAIHVLRSTGDSAFSTSILRISSSKWPRLKVSSPRSTLPLIRSTVALPIRITRASPLPTSVRRSAALTRARTSRMLKGFVM